MPVGQRSAQVRPTRSHCQANDVDSGGPQSGQIDMPAAACVNESGTEQRAANHQVDDRPPPVDLQRLLTGWKSAAICSPIDRPINQPREGTQS